MERALVALSGGRGDPLIAAVIDGDLKKVKKLIESDPVSADKMVSYSNDE